MKKQILLLLAFLSILASCQQKEEQPENTGTKIDMTQYVKMVNVGEGHDDSGISVLGVVTSNTQATPAFKTGGVIEKTFFKEGNYVQKGQLLATLLMTEIDAQVHQAEEGFAKAKRDLERVQNLFQDSVATLEQLQNTKSALIVASKTLEIAHFNQQHSEVRATISGRIIKQLLHTGEIAGPGMPVYAILGVSKSDWRVTAKLVDKDWAKLKVGDRVALHFDAYPNKTYKGKVKEKSVIASDASGSLDVVFSCITQPSSLAAGMVCRVSIPNKKSDAQIIIPIEAIVKSNGHQATVFTIENGKAKKIEINILRLLGDRVIVASGLENVKQIVTIGAIFLEDGDEVVIANK